MFFFFEFDLQFYGYISVCRHKVLINNSYNTY